MYLTLILGVIYVDLTRHYHEVEEWQLNQTAHTCSATYGVHLMRKLKACAIRT